MSHTQCYVIKHNSRMYADVTSADSGRLWAESVWLRFVVTLAGTSQGRLSLGQSLNEGQNEKMNQQADCGHFLFSGPFHPVTQTWWHVLRTLRHLASSILSLWATPPAQPQASEGVCGPNTSTLAPLPGTPISASPTDPDSPTSRLPVPLGHV